MNRSQGGGQPPQQGPYSSVQGVTLLVNSTAVHGIPVFLNMFANYQLRKLLGAGSTQQIIVHRLLLEL